MVDQLIEGIGDEVVLFVAFLFLSICMLIYVSFKRDQAQQQQNGEIAITIILFVFKGLL